MSIAARVPTAAHLIQDELGLSARQLGCCSRRSSGTYSILQIPVGWFAERYGAQRVLAAGSPSGPCATMLVGVAHSFAALLALRLLLGHRRERRLPMRVETAGGRRSASKASAWPTASSPPATSFGPAVGSVLRWIAHACTSAGAPHSGSSARCRCCGSLPWSRVRLPRKPPRRAPSDDPTLRDGSAQPSLWGTSARTLLEQLRSATSCSPGCRTIVVRERGFSTAEMASLHRQRLRRERR